MNHFNPRSHERSDHKVIFRSDFFNISIHAPTRGATLKQGEGKAVISFQSTLPREERRNIQIPTGGTVISIHAPTRGATTSAFARELILSISIHAPTRGATHHVRKELIGGAFQSTLPREERPLSFQINSKRFYFNPRSHERSDSPVGAMFVGNNISIHAPTRGATAASKTINSFLDISIHAPTRGATSSLVKNCHPPLISIHAPTRGATIPQSVIIEPMDISIHAPTRGATYKRYY